MNEPRDGPASDRARTIALCYGTRPQVIKASRLAAALRDHRLVRIDTGQHYDYALNALLYEQLGVAPPDRFLEVGSGPPAEQTSSVLERMASALGEVRPDLVIVIGDTVSTLGAALAASLMRIPLVHVEAGLRARASGFIEETARRVADQLATLLCAPSARAAEALASEGVRGRIVVTGDVARDVLLESGEKARARFRAGDWPVDRKRPFLLATLHRAELVDRPERLRNAIEALAALPLPVLFPVHPRTRARLAELDPLPAGDGLHFLEPLGYLETIGSIEAAAAVITDSGGVQREAYWLGTPCVTLREETEWLETLEVGANRLVSPDRLPGGLAAGLEEALALPRPGPWPRSHFGRGDAATRIAEAIRGL